MCRRCLLGISPKYYGIKEIKGASPFSLYIVSKLELTTWGYLGSLAGESWLA